MKTIKEEIEWVDVDDCLPGDDIEFDNLVYRCLCQVQLEDPDPNDDPEVLILEYWKRKKKWKLHLDDYDWGWRVKCWAKVPYGPGHRMAKIIKEKNV